MEFRKLLYFMGLLESITANDDIVILKIKLPKVTFDKMMSLLLRIYDTPVEERSFRAQCRQAFEHKLESQSFMQVDESRLPSILQFELLISKCDLPYGVFWIKQNIIPTHERFCRDVAFPKINECWVLDNTFPVNSSSTGCYRLENCTSYLSPIYLTNSYVDQLFYPL